LGDWDDIRYGGRSSQMFKKARKQQQEDLKAFSEYWRTTGTSEIADIEEIEEVIEQEDEGQEKKAKSVLLIDKHVSINKKSKGQKAKEETELSPLAQELVNRGITKATAIDFALSFDEEYILEKISLHDYKKETLELTTNAAGWLREAIAQDYKPSEQQLKKQAQLQKKQAQQEEQRTLEEKAREIQEARLTEDLAQFPDDEQWVRERVVEHVKVSSPTPFGLRRETTIKAFGGEPFTEAEIEAMYLRYQAQAPKTDEEKRGWLISHDSKYALSAILSELNGEQQKSQKEASKAAAQKRLP
jgi:hypothetical protein